MSTASLLTPNPLPRGDTHFDVSQVLAANVALMRGWNSWSKEELALHSGVSRPIISDIERGERNPRLDTVVQLAFAMNASVEKLLQQ